ncbi:MAG: alpha/beta hydrolase-fold protein [Eubacteriales bacterium]
MANIRLYYFSEALQMKVGVNVIIPENTWGHSLAHREKGYRYPVLWLQSGGGFDYTDWQRYTALELYAAEAGIAVVCSGTYCSGYMDTKHGDFKYFTQLSIETPKVVRHLFPLSEDPKYNYIAGFSMGGYGTMKWMLRDPEQFAAFGIFSGSKNIVDMLPDKEDKDSDFYMFPFAFGDKSNVKDTKDDNIYMLKKQLEAGKKFPRGYMATGEEDSHYEDNIRFMDLYHEMGLEFEEVRDHGAHNWEYCDRHVKKFIDWIDVQNTYKRNVE